MPRAPAPDRRIPKAVKLTPAEARLLEQTSDEAGVTTSSYLRSLVRWHLGLDGEMVMRLPLVGRRAAGQAPPYVPRRLRPPPEPPRSPRSAASAACPHPRRRDGRCALCGAAGAP